MADSLTAVQPDRRRLIAAVGALVGAALANALGAKKASAAQTPVCVDADNSALGNTGLSRAQAVGTGEPVFSVAAFDGAALEGHSATGAGVVGLSGAGTQSVADLRNSAAGGVFASDFGSGVVGVACCVASQSCCLELAQTPAGMTGVAFEGRPGVVGLSHTGTGTADLRASLSGVDTGVGVVGLQGPAGAFPPVATSSPALLYDGGVAGVSIAGTGLRGTAVDRAGVGVTAGNLGGGPALRVQGAAEFATTGSGTIPIKSTTHLVADANVTQKSHVMVTFTSENKKLFLTHVDLMPGVGFMMYLSKKQKLEVGFTYLIVESGR